MTKPKTPPNNKTAVPLNPLDSYSSVESVEQMDTVAFSQMKAIRDSTVETLVSFASLYGEPPPAELVTKCSKEIQDPFAWNRTLAAKMTPLQITSLLMEIANSTGYQTFVIAIDPEHNEMKVGYASTLTLSTQCLCNA